MTGLLDAGDSRSCKLAVIEQLSDVAVTAVYTGLQLRVSSFTLASGQLRISKALRMALACYRDTRAGPFTNHHTLVSYYTCNKKCKSYEYMK